MMLLADERLQLIVEHRIAQHLQVGREDRSILVAQLLGHLVAISTNLAGDCFNRSIEPFQFILNGVTQDEPVGNPEPLVIDDKCLANGNAGRNSYPL